MTEAKLSVSIGHRWLALQTGDITKIPTEAMGNAANSELAHGTGVNGAIHQAGGPSIMEELATIRREKGRCPPMAFA